ncbi:GldM family protein [Hanstruepera ponticola]|uniref:GldM family protein n=1 Tax=Hanstruepera ponticola TaxID=2042995 RepID=UPI000CF0405B|nr:GldM family protein [Hanstruepera ponticola]
MKHLFYALFLLASLSCFSQEPPKAVVEVNKMNIVYRGAGNTLTLSMPGTVSFEASAPGLRILNDSTAYNLMPQSGDYTVIKFKGLTKDGDTIYDTKELRIMDLPAAIGTFNKLGCGKECLIELTKDDFLNGSVGIKFDNFLHEYTAEVTSFKLKLNNEIYTIEGDNVRDSIEDINLGDSITIYDIRAKYSPPFSYFKMKKPSTIRINIIKL